MQRTPATSLVRSVVSGGTRLAWGAVGGNGFGCQFWDVFSVGDLLILNALTIVTEFIGVSLALDFLGCPKTMAVPAAVCCCSQWWPVARSVVQNS